MNELNKVGDQFQWSDFCRGTITYVSDDESWADVFFTKNLHSWAKRMPLPLSPGAIPIESSL